MIQPASLHNASGYGSGNALVKVEGRDITGRKHDFHYLVPKENADEFASNIKKENSKLKNRVKAKILLGTIGSAVLGLFAAKKAGIIMKTLSALVFTSAGFVGSTLWAGASSAKTYRKFLDKYQAEEVHFLKTPMNAYTPQIKLEKPVSDAQNAGTDM